MMTNILLGAMVFCLLTIGVFTLMLTLVVWRVGREEMKDRRKNETTGHVCLNRELLDCSIDDVYDNGVKVYSMLSEIEVCHECRSVTTFNLRIPLHAENSHREF